MKMKTITGVPIAGIIVMAQNLSPCRVFNVK